MMTPPSSVSATPQTSPVQQASAPAAAAAAHVAATRLQEPGLTPAAGRLEWPKAVAPPAQQRAPPLRRRTTWLGASWKVAKRLCGCNWAGSFLALLVALTAPAAWSPLLARSVTIASDVAEEIGGATGRMMGAGANMSSSAARVFSALTDNTLNLADTAWTGIDLVNVSVNSSAGRLFIDGAEDLIDAVESPEAKRLMGLPDHWQSFLRDVLSFASPSRPVVDLHRNFFYSASSFTALDLHVKWLDSGHVGVSWRGSEVTFAARWCNPLWELTSDVTSEHLRIAELLGQAIDATISRPDLHLAKAHLQEAPVLVPPGWAIRAWRWARKQLRPRLSMAPASGSDLAATAPATAGDADSRAPTTGGDEEG